MSEFKSELDKYVESLLNESRDIAASNINNMLKEQLAQSSNENSECAGTYYVSGYKREDGTEVNGYMRTCGAAHNENKVVSDGAPLEAKIEKDLYIENSEPAIYAKKVSQPEIYARKKNGC